MIARPTPIGNVWRASSVLWFLSFAVVLSIYWPALDELGRAPSWLSVLLGPWLGGTLVLGVIGVFWKEAPASRAFYRRGGRSVWPSADSRDVSDCRVGVFHTCSR